MFSYCHVCVWYNVEPSSWQEFRNMPTLLRFVGRLGLNAAMGMELFCLIGIVLSFVALVSRQCRNFVFFIVMWMMYLSVFQVSFTNFSFTLMCESFLGTYIAQVKSVIMTNS